MTWHKDCRKADVTVIDFGLGNLVPCCNSCGEVCPSDEDDALVAQQNGAVGLDIPLEPSLGQGRLHWPSSIRYFDDEDLLHSCGVDPPLKDDPQGQRDEDIQASALACSGPATSTQSPCFQELEGRHIRLLHLSNGTFNDPLHINLTVEDFAFGVEYEALSYTWADDKGNSKKSCSVYYGTTWDVIKVTENCANALRRLRFRNKIRTLWVDAVCINQENIPERSHQVDMMADIFACAKRVIVYLGENEPGSFDDEPIANTRHQQQIEELCNRPYFSRIWVVQELAFAATKTVICGSKTWDWESFYPLACRSSDATGLSWIKYCNDRKAHESLELFKLLCDTTICQSSDPRDRIFALLGLVVGSRAMGLIPDYSLSLSQVMIGATGYFLTHSSVAESRRIFGLACTAGVSSWPSWVPNWTDIGLQQWYENRELSLENWGSDYWTPFVPLRFVETSGPTIGKALGCLKLQGFLVASESDSSHLTFSDDLPFCQASSMFTVGKGTTQNDLKVIYIPHCDSYFLLSAKSVSEEHVAGRLLTVGSLNVQRPHEPGSFPGSFPIHLPYSTDGQYSPMVASISAWVKALFRSGMFTGANLSLLVEPWTRCVESRAKYPEEILKRKRLWVRVILRKAVIYNQTLHLLLKRSTDSNEGEVIDRTLSLIQNIGFFIQDLSHFVSMGSFLEDVFNLDGFLWKFRPLGKFSRIASAKFQNEKPLSRVENQPLFDSFSQFLTQLLIMSDSYSSAKESQRIEHLKSFITFLSTYISLPHNAKLCGIKDDGNHNDSVPESAMRDMSMDGRKGHLLPRHMLEYLTSRHSITSLNRKEEERWQTSGKDSTEDKGSSPWWIEQLNAALYKKGPQVFAPQLIDVYFI